MNASSFAAVESALVSLFRAALPRGIEVTTWAPALAAEPPRDGGRVNVALLRVETEVAMRNAPRNPPISPGGETGATFVLGFLVTVMPGMSASGPTSVAPLLEAVVGAVAGQPELRLTAPGLAETRVVLALQDWPVETWSALWQGLRMEWRPAIWCAARPVRIGG